MDRPGMRPVDNVADLGVKPVMYEPPFAHRLFAMVDCGGWEPGDPVEAPGPQPTVTVRGISVDGTEVRKTLTVFSHDALVVGYALKLTPDPDDPDGTRYVTLPTDPLFAAITSITISKPSDPAYVPRYIHVCAQCNSNPYITRTVATCNPHERNPRFRHYELVGYPPCVPCDILAEVRMGHIDLVEDDDELPFDTSEPVGWMIRANWEDNAGEVSRGDQFRAKAEAWLKRMDDTDKTVQTRVTVNSQFAGSQGEVSMRSWNI